MIKCGMFPSDAEANVKSRRMAFKRAIREFDKGKTQQNKSMEKNKRTKGALNSTSNNMYCQFL